MCPNWLVRDDKQAHLSLGQSLLSRLRVKKNAIAETFEKYPTTTMALSISYATLVVLVLVASTEGASVGSKNDASKSVPGSSKSVQSSRQSSATQTKLSQPSSESQARNIQTGAQLTSSTQTPVHVPVQTVGQQMQQQSSCCCSCCCCGNHHSSGHAGGGDPYHDLIMRYAREYLQDKHMTYKASKH